MKEAVLLDFPVLAPSCFFKQSGEVVEVDVMGDIRPPEGGEQVVTYPAIPVAEHAAVIESARRDIGLMVAVIEDKEAALSDEA